MLPPAAREHYLAQQRRIVATLALTRREWAAMGDDFDASWSRVGPRIQLLTASAQLGAARAGAAYVPAALAQQGGDVASLADVDPRSFAGLAPDGRSLDSLLYGAVTRAKQASEIKVDGDGFRAAVLGGASPAEALAVGGRWLDMAVHTLVADAARGAASVQIATRPRVGWVRMVNPPCCSRCAVLSGKFFRWNQSFKRHPRCDCTHSPSRSDAADVGRQPDVSQITDLSAHERQALAEGADLGQVVNARRGASGMTTSEGTTKHGLAGARLQGRRRLTPDAIYRLSSTREEALGLLAQHGYLL